MKRRRVTVTLQVSTVHSLENLRRVAWWRIYALAAEALPGLNVVDARASAAVSRAKRCGTH